MIEPTTPELAPTHNNSRDARIAFARFGAVVASVGPSIDDDDRLLEVLARLVTAACEFIESAEFASVTIDLQGHTFTACTTDADITSAVDEEQYTLDEGPCLTASRERGVVVADCIDGDDRWPRFGPTAAAAGLSSALSAPIEAAEESVGAINLFSSVHGGFDSVDEQMLSALTAAVGFAVTDYAAKRSTQNTVEGLRAAMEHRASIEQAKGIMMALHHIGPDEAFATLATRSQNENRKLRDIAVDLVAAVSRAAEPR